MFGNFIYFIVVLLIYSTYQPAGETNFAPSETLMLFLIFLIFFVWMNRRVFAIIENSIEKAPFARLDHRFDSVVTRQSVFAIFLFALNIYALNLPAFFINIGLFRALPTLLALVFLCLFILFLSIVWYFAYGPYRLITGDGDSRRAYVASNISFSVPVILPWLILSLAVDIIHILPFDLPKRLLSTPEGEVLFFLFFLVVVASIGPVMIQKFWRCRPLEESRARQRIDALCRRAGVGYADILYWPLFGGRMITAGVMGLFKRFRYILVTGGSLRFLQPDEMDAVVAHEIGHVKRHHLQFYLLFFVGYLLLSYSTFDMVVYLLLYASPVYRALEAVGLNQATVMTAAFSMVLIVIFLVYFRFIFGFFMRNFERQADLYVYELFDTADPLISTFHKITAATGQSPDRPNWHHFSIQERVDYLRRCEIDRGWITRHNRKVNKSIALFMIGFVLVGWIGYHLNYGEAGTRLSRHFFEKIVIGELERSPDNPELYRMAGDFYFSEKKYERAEWAYRNALRIRPDDANVLNNLAWMYATSEDERFRKPEEALELSLRAVALDRTVHVLDTLAESYYVNGRYADAIAVGRQALAETDRDRDYFEGQLKKFMAAADRKNGV